MVAFNRPEIKKIAQLRVMQQYWPLVGVVAILLAIASSVATIEYILMIPFALIPLAGIVAVFAISIAGTLFLIGPISMGTNYMFYKVYKGEKVQLKDMFAAFTADTYLRAVETYGLVFLFTFLWCLLFYVPGIVKAYSYSMAPYIIMEDKNITPMEAINKSKRMTYGYKGDIFLMGMSFFGWILLCELSFMILYFFWVGPYMSVAMAGIYDRLKQNSDEDRKTMIDNIVVSPVYDPDAYVYVQPEQSAPSDESVSASFETATELEVEKPDNPGENPE